MYRLPPALRPLLAEPFGPVLNTQGALKKARNRTIVCVGDVVTQTFLRNDVVPKLMIIDGLTQRGTRVEHALEGLPSNVKRVTVTNPPAQITGPLLAAMDRALREKGSTLITVHGEEDLAALPAMIMAPEGAAVVYGQPPRRVTEATSAVPAEGGVVVVLVTAQVRERAKDILNQMEVK